MKKTVSVQAAAEQLFRGEVSAVWGAIVSGKLQATALAETKTSEIDSYDADVDEKMARCFLAGDETYRFSAFRDFPPRLTGPNEISISEGGKRADFVVRRATVLVEVPDRQALDHDLSNEATKRELERLIGEAPKVAPSISRYDGTYRHVNDEGYDAQKAQRWSLEAAGLLVHLARAGIPVFMRLNGEYCKFENASRHSQSIFVHQTQQLLQTAVDLLDSPLGNLTPSKPTDYESVGAQDETAQIAEVAQPAQLTPPETVTLPWLIKHVSIDRWLAFGGVLIAVFVGGIQASKLKVVQEIFSLVAAICIP